MSPQAGDEDGRGAGSLPQGHSSVTACQGDAQWALQGSCWGSDFGESGIWHPWAGRGCRHGSAVAQDAGAGSCRRRSVLGQALGCSQEVCTGR